MQALDQSHAAVGADSTAGVAAVQPLRFVHRGLVRTCAQVPPDRTLLALLREDLGLTAVKEGCASGDCGACTVAVADRGPDGALRWRAINSCIRPAHAVAGTAVWTAQDLPHDPLLGADGRLHPVQLALVQAHGSQCGFCTPGFVMSLFVLYQRWPGPAVPSRAALQEALSGNLCRCTGYRPILEAAAAMWALPSRRVNEQALVALLDEADGAEASAAGAQATDAGRDDALPYQAPRTLAALLAVRRRWPQAVVVAGATDLGLRLTKQHERWTRVLDVSRCVELQRIETVERDGQPWLRLGAAVTLQAAFDALVGRWPALHDYAARFAGQPIRDGGTLGGNIVNGSPIGDSMPLLIALGAELVLMRADERDTRQVRRLPLEGFYLGYRRTDLGPDELLAYIDVPLAQADATQVWAFKVSKRFEDDISAVSLGLAVRCDAAGHVVMARLGVGGVAAVPARACATEAALAGQPWCAETLQRAAAVLQAEFEPLSDGRASAAYRRALLGALMQRVWDGERLDAAQPWEALVRATASERA